MAPLPVEPFREQLRRLSSEAFAAFVVDLWAERGLDPRRAGGLVVARDPYTGEDHALAPVAGDVDPTAAPADADVVVTPLTDPDVGSDATVVDGTELHRLACYAVDRDVRDRLLEEHLGLEPPARAPSATVASGADQVTREPTGEEQRSVGREGRSDGGAGEILPELSRREALATGAGAMLAAGAFGALLLQDGAGGLASSGLLGPSTGTPPGDGSRADGRLAPGVGEAGVVEPLALAAAHEAAIEGVSYTLTSRRAVEADDGTVLSGMDVSVALAADRSFRASLETDGPLGPLVLGTPPATATFWSDGDRYLRRFTVDGETTYNEFRPPDEYVGTWRYWVRTVPFGGGYGGPERFYGGVFEEVPTATGEDLRLDGRTAYRLESAAATPRSRSPAFAQQVTGVDRVDLRSIVDERGLVHSLHLSHAGEVAREGEADPTPVAVSWTVHYRSVGETTVDRPDWYGQAVDE